MIRVRNDDVLMHWNWKKLVNQDHIKDPVTTFKIMHQTICSRQEQLLHVPAILCRNIQEFPEVLPFMRSEADNNRMEIQLHGWDHVDYGKYTFDGICQDLKLCTDFMNKTFARTPTIWYTPWGANTDNMQKAAKEFNLMLVDCSNLIRPWDVDGRDDLEVFVHWWEGTENLDSMIGKINA